jgi:hypothetical protein
MTFQAYLDTIKAKTGLGPGEFIELARAKGFLVKGQKAAPVQAWLKEDYGLGPGHSMALVSIFREAVAPAPSKADRLAKHFAGAKSVWQLTYDEMMATVMKFGSDVWIHPTDTYISLNRKNGTKIVKFAIVATSAKRMDVGLKLKGVEPTARLAPAGSWNGMVTHRVQLFDGAELDDEVKGWLREAYDRAG